MIYIVFLLLLTLFNVEIIMLLTIDTDFSEYVT